MEKKVAFEVQKTARLIRRYMDSHALKDELDHLTGMHGWAIGYFYNHRDKDVFQRDFEKECNIRRSSATSILQCMEKNGLIVREGVPYDARLKKITLTPKALELQQRVFADFAALEAKLTGCLSEEELACFFTVLEKIQKEVDPDAQTSGCLHS